MKKILLSLLVLFTAFAFAACSKDTEPKKETAEFDLTEYKGKVATLNEEILELSTLLSNTGKFQHNFWGNLNSMGGNVDFDSMVERGFDWLEKNSDVSLEDVEKMHGQIQTQYTDIMSIKVDASAEEIRDNLTGLFEDFDSLYKLITSPSGDIDAFADRFNTLSNDIVSANSSLEALVSE